MEFSYARRVVVTAALGGLLFGYDTGVMSGALLFITPEFGMRPAQEGFVTSMLLVGAAVGAISGGAVADALGRRRTLITAGALFVAGSIWCAFAGSVGSLAAARTVLGLAVGAVSIVTPMYISEIVPTEIRGRMVSLNTLMIVLGQLVAYVVNSLLAPLENWRLMLGAAALPGIALAIGMAMVPETPLWLARRGRGEEADRIAQKAGIDAAELEAARAEAESNPSVSAQWRALADNRWLRVTVIFAALLGVTQQITGVNAIVYFAPTMMNKVGLSTANAVYTSIVIGIVSVVACWVGLKLVDRIGRRKLLLAGLGGNILFLLALSLTYRAAESNTSLAWVALACMAGFIASQQAAVSPTTWLLISELVPPHIRGVGMGLAGLSLWAMNWVVAQFFLPLVNVFSATATFAIFAALGCLAAVFVARRVPETMGKSLDSVAEEMERRYAREGR